MASSQNNSYLETLRFRGYARVRLSSLNFENASRASHRSLSDRNVCRLVNIFRTEGCQRSNENHFVKVVVERARLDEAISRYGASILHALPECWQDVPALELDSLDCLNGLHRIAAAKQHLSGPDRWWVVCLLTNDLPSSVCTYIAEEYENELASCDGEIFRKIRLYHAQKDASAENKWWARLSETKRKDLKQLLKDERYARTFDSMLSWPGLWAPVRLGSLHRLLTMKCDEELLRYLDRVASVWASIISGVTDSSSPIYVDQTSVELLETLAPAWSSSDANLIRESMQTKKLFPLLKNEQARATLLQNILQVRCSIPSLFTFFENLKYLEPCAKILRSLLPSKQKRSVFEALSASYQAPAHLSIEYGPRDVRLHPSHSIQGDRQLGYWQLWLYTLRNFASMSDATPRKDQCKAKPQPAEPDPTLWQAFGTLAVSLGFKTGAAVEFMSSDGEVQLASQIVQRSTPKEDSEEAIKTIAAVLKSLAKKREAVGPVEFIGDRPLTRERRCGRPYESDHEADRGHLFLPFIYAKPACSGEEVTSLYCKWDMFHAFFEVEAVTGLEFTAAYSENSPQIMRECSPCELCHGVREELNTSNEKLCRLQSSLSDEQIRAQSFHDQLKEARESRDSLARELRETEVRLEERVEAVESKARNELNAAMDAQAELQHAKVELQSQVATMRSGLSGLDATTTELEGLRGELQRSRSEQQILTSTQAAMATVESHLCDRVHIYRSTLDVALCKFMALRSQRGAHISELARVKQRLAELRQGSRRLEEQLAASRISVEHADSRYKHSETEIKSLQGQLSSASAALEDAERREGHLELANKSLQDQLASAITDGHNAKHREQELMKTQSSLEAQLASTNADLQNVEGRESDLKKKEANLEAQLVSALSQLRDAEERQRKLQIENRNLDEQLNAADNSVIGLESDLRSNARDLQEKEAELAGMRDEIQAKDLEIDHNTHAREVSQINDHRAFHEHLRHREAENQQQSHQMVRQFAQTSQHMTEFAARVMAELSQVRADHNSLLSNIRGPDVLFLRLIKHQPKYCETMKDFTLQAAKKDVGDYVDLGLANRARFYVGWGQKHHNTARQAIIDPNPDVVLTAWMRHQLLDIVLHDDQSHGLTADCDAATYLERRGLQWHGPKLLLDTPTSEPSSVVRQEGSISSLSDAYLPNGIANRVLLGAPQLYGAPVLQVTLPVSFTGGSRKPGYPPKFPAIGDSPSTIQEVTEGEMDEDSETRQASANDITTMVKYRKRAREGADETQRSGDAKKAQKHQHETFDTRVLPDTAGRTRDLVRKRLR